MNEPALSPLENEVVQAYLAIGDALRVAALPEWMIADLTISQLKGLMLLAYHGALAVSELAGLLKLGSPAASILVQQLVDHALVERSEDAKDRRRTLVRLTTEGAALIVGRHKQKEVKMHAWLGQMCQADLTSLLQGLNALAEIALADQTPHAQD